MSFSQLLFHIVFSTKNREPLILPDFEARLHAYLGGLIRERRGVPLCINGIEDHLHILLSWRPDGKLSELMRDVKSISTGWVHDTIAGSEEFAWQEGFAAFSVSYSQVGAVKTYIENQKEHHRTESFKDEFIKFLDRHQIKYDPRYVWN